MSAPIAVIGAGAWGTALAWLLAGKGEQVRLWAFGREVAYGIVASHENKLFLPGVPLPAALEPTTSLAEAVDGVQLVVFVVPSHAAAKVAASLAPHLPAGVPFVTATKGIEPEQLRLISDLLEETLPASRGPAVAVFGPRFAVEVCRHLPTAVAPAAPAAGSSAGPGGGGSSGAGEKSRPRSSSGRAPSGRGWAPTRGGRPSPNAPGWLCPSSGGCARCPSKGTAPAAPSRT